MTETSEAIRTQLVQLSSLLLTTDLCLVIFLYPFPLVSEEKVSLLLSKVNAFTPALDLRPPMLQNMGTLVIPCHSHLPAQT